MTPDGGREGGLSVRDQIERYRSAFISVVLMIVVATLVAGYILAHENLKLPSWVPVLGRSYYTLKADFQTAQAVTPGQGQAVTIAGAKIGEIATVELHNGVAIVTMKVTPKYARIYRDATALLRPKTQLQDITVEVDPGTPAAGRLPSGGVIPISQTAPNVNFDEFLSSLDADTRGYLQELLAGLGEGFKNNGRAASATFKRFDPTARYLQEIAQQLEIRHENIARSIHNFRLLTEALGGKDKQLAELIQSSNAVFATFAREDASFESTLKLLPGALHKTGVGLGKLAVATDVLGPTLHKLLPFANALAPANQATTNLSNETTPVIKNEIRPFAREILPVINRLGPATQPLGEAFPKLSSSFAVLNEFFNELAYNPGASRGGFMFFLDWANHNLNSVVSASDAHGPLGSSLVYFNCKILPIFQGVQEINPSVNLLIGLLRPPSGAECQGLEGSAKAAAARARKAGQGLFSGLGPEVFGGVPGGIAPTSSTSAASGGRQPGSPASGGRSLPRATAPASSASQASTRPPSAKPSVAHTSSTRARGVGG